MNWISIGTAGNLARPPLVYSEFLDEIALLSRRIIYTQSKYLRLSACSISVFIYPEYFYSYFMYNWGQLLVQWFIEIFNAILFSLCKRPSVYQWAKSYKTINTFFYVTYVLSHPVAILSSRNKYLHFTFSVSDRP